MVFKVKDHYFKRAKDENFLARSIYKLEEVQQKYQVLTSGDHVIDFGYYPGSWIQFAQTVVGPQGWIVGVDVQEIHPKFEKAENIKLFCQDIFHLRNLQDVGAARGFDVVLSDMAPSTTGIRSVDQDRSLNLVEQVFSLLPEFLRPSGNLVIKVFESENAQKFLKDQKKHFERIHYLRPKSTRSTSKEFFVIGKTFRP